jgi:transposase
MTVTIGIDPHKGSHTATVIGPDLVEIATIRVRSSRTATDQLIDWAGQWPERRWAIEGARGLGQFLAQHLVAVGETVIDVPATLTARVRSLETGHGRKTDRTDARAVAVVAAQRSDLAQVAADDHTRVLRLLADRRDELTRERRRVVNRLHRHLRDLLPGGAPRHLSAKTAGTLLAKIRPENGVVAAQKQIARDLLTDVRRLDKAIADNRKRCTAAVAASGTTLTSIRGISDVLAAKILGHIGDITRFPSADHLASYAGTAPIEASSGDVVRHRLSRRGNRQLNNAIHLAAHVQTIFPGPGRDYYQRRIETGNSRTEALRLLKRQITKSIYRTLAADAERTHQTIAA